MGPTVRKESFIQVLTDPGMFSIIYGEPAARRNRSIAAA